MKKTREPPAVDMSPQAVAKRLEDLASLYELGRSLARVRIIGPVNGPSDESKKELPRP